MGFIYITIIGRGQDDGRRIPCGATAFPAGMSLEPSAVRSGLFLHNGNNSHVEISLSRVSAHRLERCGYFKFYVYIGCIILS